MYLWRKFFKKQKKACQTAQRRLNVSDKNQASLAQLVEQLICNHQVVSSSLTAGSALFKGVSTTEAPILLPLRGGWNLSVLHF